MLLSCSGGLRCHQWHGRPSVWAVRQEAPCPSARPLRGQRRSGMAMFPEEPPEPHWPCNETPSCFPLNCEGDCPHEHQPGYSTGCRKFSLPRCYRHAGRRFDDLPCPGCRALCCPCHRGAGICGCIIPHVYGSAGRCDPASFRRMAPADLVTHPADRSGLCSGNGVAGLFSGPADLLKAHAGPAVLA